MPEPKTKRLESLTQKQRAAATDATEEENEPVDSATEEAAERSPFLPPLRTSYGVNQGDQAAQSAREFDAKAKREAGRMTAAGNKKAAELRDQAKKLRGDE